MVKDKPVIRRGGLAHAFLAGVLTIALTAVFSVADAQAARVLTLPKVTAGTYEIDYQGRPAIVVHTLLVRRLHGMPNVRCNRCRRLATHKVLTSRPSRTSKRYTHADWILQRGRAVKIRVTRGGWIGRYLLMTAQRRKGRLGLGYKESGCLSRRGTEIPCPRSVPKPSPTVIVITVPVVPPAARPDSGQPPTAAGTYGPFNIRAAHSGKCLDVFQAQMTNGVPVQQYQCLGASQTNQLWQFVATGDGLTFYVKALHSGKCLDVPEAKTADGVHVHQYQCLGYAYSNERWYRTEVPPGGTFNLRAAHSNSCLDVSGGPGATGDENPVEQHQCLGASQTNQQWYLTSP